MGTASSSSVCIGMDFIAFSLSYFFFFSIFPLCFVWSQSTTLIRILVFDFIRKDNESAIYHRLSCRSSWAGETDAYLGCTDLYLGYTELSTHTREWPRIHYWGTCRKYQVLRSKLLLRSRAQTFPQQYASNLWIVPWRSHSLHSVLAAYSQESLTADSLERL